MNFAVLIRRTVCSLFLLLVSCQVLASGLVMDRMPADSVDLAPVVEFMFEDNQRLAVTELAQELAGQTAAGLSRWQAGAGEDLNFGFSEQPLWLRFHLRNIGNEPLTPLLVLAAPTLDYVDVFESTPDGHHEQLLQSGNAYPYAHRQVDNRHFVVPLNLAPGETRTYHIRIQEAGSLQAPLSLWRPQAFFSHYQYEQTKYALYFGLLLTLMAYNLFLAVTLRSSGHSYYVGYIAALIWIQASQTGFGSQFLWQDSPAWGYLAVQIGVPVSLMFAGLFSMEALNLRNLPGVARLTRTVIYLAQLIMVVGLFMPLTTHLQVTVAMGIAGSCLFLLAGLLAWRRGDLSARLYTLAWVALALGATVYGLTKFGLLPSNAISQNAFWLGSAIEGLMLSFSLAARMSALQKSKLELQQQIVSDREKQFELESKAIAAQTKDRTRGEFIATFSHEIRTPMNGVLGMAELLSETELGPEQRKYLQAIRSSGENLLQLINSVLDFSKIEAGRLELDPSPVRLRSLINELSTLFETVAEDKGLAFGIRYEGRLPEVMMLDQMRLRQILLNLLANAFKFTERGSVELVVRCIDDELLRIEVTDTGIGISEEAQQKLFESFYQADKSTTRRYGGTGLGLPICRNLVELHGGRMGVTSAPECGSTFWFEVPLQVAAADVPAPAVDPFHGAAGEPGPLASAARILVAEDNTVNALLIRRYLERYGCEVELVEDGEEALHRYRQNSSGYDLVLLDYEMPKLDGHQVTVGIREHEAEHGLTAVPVVGISAHSMLETVQKLRQAGMNDFLPKPINRETVESMLRKFTTLAPAS